MISEFYLLLWKHRPYYVMKDIGTVEQLSLWVGVCMYNTTFILKMYVSNNDFLCGGWWVCPMFDV